MRSERFRDGAPLAHAPAHSAAYFEQARAAGVTAPHDRHDDDPAARAAAGVRVYAIGDIHGRLDLLESLAEAIASDIDAFPCDAVEVVLLGDLIDRGHDSRGVVKAAMGLPLVSGARQITLRGNHEHLMLKFLRHADLPAGRVWFSAGGAETLESYGLDDRVIAGLIDNPREWIPEALAAVPENHLDWLEGLPLLHQSGDYVMVHAGVRPGRDLDSQREQDLIWIREPFLSHPDPMPGHVVIHGHTPSHALNLDGNRICADTGAVYGGRLTAIVLDGADRRALSISA